MVTLPLTTLLTVLLVAFVLGVVALPLLLVYLVWNADIK